MRITRLFISCGLICSAWLFVGCNEEKPEPVVEEPVVQEMQIEPKPGDQIPMQ